MEVIPLDIAIPVRERVVGLRVRFREFIKAFSRDDVLSVSHRPPTWHGALTVLPRENLAPTNVTLR